MRIFTKIASVAVLAMGVVACNAEIDNLGGSVAESVEVGFVVPVDGTRTTIDPDGVSTRWSAGDKLAVWAKDAADNFTFENTTFTLRYFSTEFDHAYFISNIAPMADGDYTYMFSYPLPTSVEGTKATYTVPSAQSGKYDGKYDVMVADLVSEGALTTGEKIELNTIMRHQMHALKITVPEGRNLYGSRFYRLEITFPQNVVGEITVDVSDPAATPVCTPTSNTIVVENSEGFDVGSEIWVFVLPGTVDGDVSYYVRGERRKSNEATYSISKELTAGKITPIRMAIPEVFPYYTAVHFSIDQNYLGEDFNFFEVYDASDNLMATFQRNAQNKYSVDYEGEFDADQYDNSSWKIIFDSDNARVATSVSLGDMTDYTEHTRWMSVPYLFSENFSSLAAYNGDYTAGPYTSVEGATTSGQDLAQYGIASGWTGARTGCDAAGTAILVAGRVDCVLAGTTRAYGRLDSPALTGIKPDKYVNVKVTFDYGGSRSGNSTYYPVGRVGFTTSQGVIDGYATQFNNNEAFTNIDGAVAVPSIPTSGSATGLTQSMTYNITDCTSSHRISWHVGHLGYKSLRINNGYGWMYVDNVKVQIVK